MYLDDDILVVGTLKRICDQVCKNQPCEHKLYQVIFCLILNVVFHFCHVFAEEFPINSALMINI